MIRKNSRLRAENEIFCIRKGTIGQGNGRDRCPVCLRLATCVRHLLESLRSYRDCERNRLGQREATGIVKETGRDCEGYGSQGAGQGFRPGLRRDAVRIVMDTVRKAPGEVSGRDVRPHAAKAGRCASPGVTPIGINENVCRFRERLKTPVGQDSSGGELAHTNFKHIFART